MPRYFSERGKNHEDVLDKIRRKYGDRARIMMHKNIPGPGIMGLLGREQVEITGYVAVGEEARIVQKDRDDETRAAILAAAGKDPARAVADASAENQSAVASDPEAEESRLGEVLREIREIKGRIPIAASTPPPEPFPVLGELSGILEDNDFDREYVQSMLDSLRAELKAAELEDREGVHERTVRMIAGGLRTWDVPEGEGPRIFILVGPTGVGKTTTIAKLAAVNGLSGTGNDVRIFTVDSFRIGARAQVETYGEIMGIPVKAIDSHDDLKAQVALASEADLILVDTIGKSPRDTDRIAEMRHMLEACGPDAEVHLAVSATTKTADLKEIMDQFEIFDYQSVVLTKLDETSRVGNLISVLSRKGKPLSYLTDGQSVPVDIAVASPARLLGRLRGLDYNAASFAEQYPAADLTAAWR